MPEVQANSARRPCARPGLLDAQATDAFATTSATFDESNDLSGTFARRLTWAGRVPGLERANLCNHENVVAKLVPYGPPERLHRNADDSRFSDVGCPNRSGGSILPRAASLGFRSIDQ